MNVHADPQQRPIGLPPRAHAEEILQVLRPDGSVDPKTDPQLESALIVRMYEQMLRTRLIDRRLTKLQRQGRIGFHVGAEGEEAAIIAATAALRKQDWVFPCYREVGAALYRGMPLQTYVDNMYGNANDIPHGRQMPDHVSSREAHYVSVTAPIGTQLTQAVGFAWGSRLRKQDVVTAAFFGDGATSSNDFHAALNFAAVFKAPTVFLLRNNGWAISVPVEKQTSAESLADKAIGYGMPSRRCDGNDALAVYATVREAVERAAAGEGPTLVEMMTYRLGPHTTSDDPSVYRDNAEVKAAEERDPLHRLRLYLERKGAWSAEQQARAEQAVADELQACVAQAEQTPLPNLESLFTDVYEHQPAHLSEQQAECLSGPRARKRHG